MKKFDYFFLNYSLKEVNLALFSFFTLFTFFSFGFWGGHEIIPFYVLFIAFTFLTSKNLWHFFGLLEFLTILFLLCCIPFFKFIYLADFFQVIIIISTISFLRCLPDNLKIKIANHLFYLSLLIVILMILQKLFPSIMDWTYQNLLIRDYSADQLTAYTGGVIGIAPEPAYMGSYLIGIWMYVRRFRKNLFNKITIITLIGLTLCASLSANLMFIFLFCLTLNSLKSFLKLILFFGICISIFFILNSSLIDRSYNFFQILFNTNIFNSLRDIDEYFGSSRLSTLVDPFSIIGCGVIFCDNEYLKGYSLFSKAFYLISPLHFLVLPLVLKWSSDRDSCLSIVAFLAYGPVLNWLLYSGFINGLKKQAYNNSNNSH